MKLSNWVSSVFQPSDRCSYYNKSKHAIFWFFINLHFRISSRLISEIHTFSFLVWSRLCVTPQHHSLIFVSKHSKYQSLNDHLQTKRGLKYTYISLNSSVFVLEISVQIDSFKLPTNISRETVNISQTNSLVATFGTLNLRLGRSDWIIWEYRHLETCSRVLAIMFKFNSRADRARLVVLSSDIG